MHIKSQDCKKCLSFNIGCTKKCTKSMKGVISQHTRKHTI